jgi:hypothetical protein
MRNIDDSAKTSCSVSLRRSLSEITPERLLTTMRAPLLQARRLESLDDRREQFGRYREVEGGVVARL